MKLFLTKSFEKDYARLPSDIQDALDRSLMMLIENPRHPSLHLKKMRGARGIWDGRISRACRFTFMLERDLCVLRRTGTYDILRTP
ncbi:hypothetical protein HY627_00575 [Candidatus Uhrbacteria bacterium]|nr:hypothetical protein [Candidatus Uhrbacteria bacterium]